MKSIRFYQVILFCMFAIMGIGSFFLDRNISPHTNHPYAKSFNFVLRYGYGVGAKNELHTFDGTFTRDMILDPPITVDLSLSDVDLERIYQKMLEIGLFDYPENVPPASDFGVTPCEEFYIRVQSNSEIKEVSWDATLMFGRNNGLKDLFESIMNALESNQVYRNLPSPRGGYI